jgi:parallel beta-helix repeat protein
VVIENLHVSNPGGDCIVVTDSANVTIRNSTIGPCGSEAVYLSDVNGASITGNTITDTVNGVLVHRSTSVVVDNNTFRHAGRNFVQFDKVTGSGSSISGNRGENALGGSNAEDLISVYQSGGTSGSPLRVVGNHLRNGGPSNSGSGIMLGDGGGGHVVVEGNALVNPGQVGIGVASGTNITVSGNRVYSDALPWSNVGIYVWNQYGSACDTIQITNNQVNWTAASGSANPWYNGGGCSNVTESGNTWSADIGPAEEPPAAPLAVEPPAEEIPAEEIPAEEIPAEEIPAEEIPAEEIPAEEIPAEEIPAEEPTVEEAPAQEPPALEPPAEEPPAEEPSGPANGEEPAVLPDHEEALPPEENGDGSA